VNEEYDLAQQEYQAAIALDSRNTQPYYSLGYLYTRQKQFDKATEIFENLLKSHPDEVASYFHLGRLAVMSGKNLNKGEEYLKKYLQTDPSDEMPSFAFTHLLLGHIYKMKENKELAKSEYQNALELDPDFKQANKTLDDLKKNKDSLFKIFQNHNFYIISNDRISSAKSTNRSIPQAPCLTV
jgi:tetratricopeptide (TPR) repeat protein